MKVNQVDTYTATIYCGLREDYGDIVHEAEEAKKLCADFVNKVGLCVTVTETEFIYQNGRENGVIVGFINYPRFPATTDKIKSLSRSLAEKMQKQFKQNRVSIVYPDTTFMLDGYYEDIELCRGICELCCIKGCCDER